MRQSPFTVTPGLLAPIAVMVIGLGAAMYLGSLVGSGESTQLLFIVLLVALVGILAFVGDYWWAPLVLISALTFRTNLFGFVMTGVDIGILILAVLLPLKVAVRRLHTAQPRLHAGRAFRVLFVFLVVHAVAIILYNKFAGVPLKNIVKAYYAVLSPLVLYWLLTRYCRTTTVRPISICMFGMYAAVIGISLPVVLLDVRTPILPWPNFLFDWTHSGVAVGAMRSYSPLLFAASLAFWPVARSFPIKMLLLALIGLSVFGATVSAGRIAIAACFVEAALFCILRRRFALILPVIAIVATLALFISQSPISLYLLPDVVHRALTPFNLSQQQTSIEKEATSSDTWHDDLRRESLDYWTSDIVAFLVGHGFKPWDESLRGDPQWTRYYEDAKRLAIQMGRTENVFSSLTNIFGLTGFLLYGWFVVHLAGQLRRARAVAPAGSFARGLCEFSLVSLTTFVLFMFVAGGPPGMNIIYWQLGLLAARPYLAPDEPAEDPGTGRSSRHEAQLAGV